MKNDSKWTDAANAMDIRDHLRLLSFAHFLLSGFVDPCAIPIRMFYWTLLLNFSKAVGKSGITDAKK